MKEERFLMLKVEILNYVFGCLGLYWVDEEIGREKFSTKGFCMNKTATKSFVCNYVCSSVE